jgi:RHS repeat-associated protein
VLPSDGSWGQCIADPSQHPSARDANLALIEAYTYDATGNRLSQQIGNNPVTTYSYPAQSHRLIQVGTAVRSFDAAGNTLTGVPGYEADSATYDARNRLTQVGSGSSAQLLSNYNGRGERVLVSQGAPAPALPTTSAAWRSSAGVRGYVYDESGQVISMLIAGNPLRYEEIIWLDHTPIGRVESSTSAVTAVHVIHSDHLNTPRALANAQTQGGQPAGTVVWRWKLNQQTATGSNAFGAQPAEEDPDGNGTSVRFDLRFPGQQYDAATGLHYNYFRDYEPETGRYVESDPIGLRGGFSTFAYSSQSPCRFVDPLGLCKVEARCNLLSARPILGRNISHCFLVLTGDDGQEYFARTGPSSGGGNISAATQKSRSGIGVG